MIGTSYLCVIILHLFFSAEGDGHLVFTMLNVLPGGNTIRLGWSVLAGSANLPVSRIIPIRVVDASFHTIVFGHVRYTCA